MKCFLHIGTEKTATTTLQNFLDLNRNELLKSGFIYTKSAGHTNNWKLFIAAYDLARRDDFTKIYGIYSDNDLSDFQNRVINELGKEIKKIVDHKSDLKIIFSSEHFQSRLTNLSEIKRLKKILNGFGVDKISVIVYLRSPADIANSLFSTAIKAGGIEKHPPTPTEHYYANICNHQNTLEKFGTVFGETALIPKIFHESEFKNGSIIEDFLDVISAPIDSVYSTSEDANKSISATGINILRRINEIIPSFVEDKPNPLRGNIFSYIEKHFSDSKYIMPSKLFEQYNLEFHESNEWVRKRYFSDKISLFPKLPHPKETKANIPDEELDNIANIIANIWTDKQNEIIQ